MTTVPTLDQLAIKHGTDKSSKHHNYCGIYEIYFKALRDKPVRVLELGVGGYKHPDKGGESLRMWCEYFKNGKVFSVDVYDKSKVQVPHNGKLFQGSQDDAEILKHHFFYEGYTPDIIIDDASHINPLTIRSFEILFPLLKKGGFYVIEDTHTSYWKDIAQDGTDFKGGTHEGTVMNFFKKMCDRINLADDHSILSIHFYKQMIVILKK